MTLDEAIKHCEEKAAELREYSDVLSETSTTPKGKEISNCLECAEEHEQLAEWLKELKDYREGLRTCENCKYEHKAETEYPCSICRCSHPNKFEWKGGAE